MQFREFLQDNEFKYVALYNRIVKRTSIYVQFCY